jgi:hypothetical protein
VEQALPGQARHLQSLDGKRILGFINSCDVFLRKSVMAEADLDVVIRQLAKQQQKDLMAAAKKRRDRYSGLAAKAKDKATRDRYKQIARDTMEQASAAARRLQISADNAADSYARSMRQAAATHAAETAAKAAKSKTEKSKPKSKAKAS